MMIYRKKIHEISCAILAGGRSRRFGSNKALAQWNEEGSTVIQTVMDACRTLTDDIFIISNDITAYSRLGLPIYPDIMAGYGPLSGVHAALRRAAAMRVLILACDMPAVSSDFLAYMAGITSWAPVITPESDSGLEPLHSIWHRSLLPVLEFFIRSGRTGLKAVLQELPCRVVAKEEIALQNLDQLSLRSTNTPEALMELRIQVLSRRC